MATSAVRASSSVKSGAGDVWRFACGASCEQPATTGNETITKRSSSRLRRAIGFDIQPPTGRLLPRLGLFGRLRVERFSLLHDPAEQVPAVIAAVPGAGVFIAEDQYAAGECAKARHHHVGERND